MFNENFKEVLIKNLTIYLTECPNDAPEFLGIIQKSLNNYKECIDSHRDSIARDGITSMLVLEQKWFRKLTLKEQLPFIIDAAYTIFPKGITTHSPIEIRFFEQFKNMIIAYDREQLIEWLESRKTARDNKIDYIAWLTKLGLL